MTRFLSLLILFPATALAQESTAADITSSQQYASMLPLILIFFVFYFLLIRPQQKRAKEHHAMLGDLKKGDEVITGGGIHGKITEVMADGQHMMVEIAKSVEVRVLKSTVHSVLGKPQPAAKPASDKKKSPNDNRVPSRDSIANDN